MPSVGDAPASASHQKIERWSRAWWGRYSSPMRAAVHTRYGPPDVVRIAEVEKPAAKDNEVLVKVHATTVNRTDSGLRAAKPFINRFFTGLRRPRVTVLGNEFAGEVEAVGRGVTFFKVGDRCSATTGPGSVPTLNTWRCPRTDRWRPCRRT